MKNKINTVAVLGMGAIGAYVLYGLEDNFKDNLWVVAEGERGKRLKEQGLIINDIPHTLNVKSPDEVHGVDLLIVCVKYGALRMVLPDIQRAVGENTTVISLLNGVDSEDIISEAVDKEQIIHALIRIASEHMGNRVTFTPPKENMGIIYGLPETLSGTVSDSRKMRLEAVTDCFKHSKLVSNESGDILKDIWRKYALNISMNIPQAILSAGIGIYSESEHAAFLSKALRNEVSALADSLGIDIRNNAFAGPGSTGAPKTARYSTLQDLDAKRPTEIEMFCGTVMRLAAKHDIPVPCNTFAYHVIKGLEEKNEGKFEF